MSHLSVLIVYSVRGRGWLGHHETLTASSAILAIIGKKREKKEMATREKVDKEGKGLEKRCE